MEIKIVLPSDRKEIILKRLNIFSLDEVPNNILGPYTYQVELPDGTKFDAEYDLSAFDEPPSKPSTPRPLPNTSEYWGAMEYWNYQAALAHEKKREQSIIDYLEAIRSYIWINCIRDEDKERITTEEDWDHIVRAVIVNSITKEELAAALRYTFQSYL